MFPRLLPQLLPQLKVRILWRVLQRQNVTHLASRLRLIPIYLLIGWPSMPVMHADQLLSSRAKHWMRLPASCLMSCAHFPFSLWNFRELWPRNRCYRYIAAARCHRLLRRNGGQKRYSNRDIKRVFINDISPVPGDMLGDGSSNCLSLRAELRRLLTLPCVSSTLVVLIMIGRISIADCRRLGDMFLDCTLSCVLFARRKLEWISRVE